MTARPGEVCSPRSGVPLAVQGRTGEARSAFNRAVYLYPGYQPAIRALAKIGA